VHRDEVLAGFDAGRQGVENPPGPITVPVKNGIWEVYRQCHRRGIADRGDDIEESQKADVGLDADELSAIEQIVEEMAERRRFGRPARKTEHG